MPLRRRRSSRNRILADVAVIDVRENNAALQGGRWELALETLNEMRASGLELNGHNWTTAIEA